MTYRKRQAGEPMAVYIHISDFDHDTVVAMDELISLLSTASAGEKFRCGTDNMITYHINRAIEYAKRERTCAIKRVNREED